MLFCVASEPSWMILPSAQCTLSTLDTDLSNLPSPAQMFRFGLTQFRSAPSQADALCQPVKTFRINWDNSALFPLSPKWGTRVGPKYWEWRLQLKQFRSEWEDLLDAPVKQKTKMQNKNAIFVAVMGGDVCKCMNYLQRDPRNGTVILVNLRERIWETKGRRWRWNRFFTGYFSKLFEFWSHLHAIWLHARAHTHTGFFFFSFLRKTKASQVAPGVKNPPANAGDARDTGALPGLGRCPLE